MPQSYHQNVRPLHDHNTSRDIHPHRFTNQRPAPPNVYHNTNSGPNTYSEGELPRLSDREFLLQEDNLELMPKQISKSIKCPEINLRAEDITYLL